MSFRHSPVWFWMIAVVVLVGASTIGAEEAYPVHPDSQRREGVPEGSVRRAVWKSTTVYPGTIREYYIYVPDQYKAGEPAALMVFQDGHTYVSETGTFRAPIVFDNLIHQGEMPVTIGLFINPGHRGSELPENPWRGSNRSVEYDTLSDDYARFLELEMIPFLKTVYSISDDPEKRAICGISSGGICAWTVAWERPDLFRKVMSHIGSFTNIRGGHVYPALIRKTDPKPIRGFFQEGTNDLDNEHGNWPLSNRQMEAALKFANYDYKYVWGEGEHNGKHGGAIFPDSLRWLWRTEEVASSAESDAE